MEVLPESCETPRPRTRRLAPRLRTDGARLQPLTRTGQAVGDAETVAGAVMVSSAGIRIQSTG
jgi:hypothetical protein